MSSYGSELRHFRNEIVLNRFVACSSSMTPKCLHLYAIAWMETFHRSFIGRKASILVLNSSSRNEFPGKQKSSSKQVGFVFDPF